MLPLPYMRFFFHICVLGFYLWRIWCQNYCCPCYHACMYGNKDFCDLIWFDLKLWHKQAIFESKGDKLSSSAESKIRTQRVSDTLWPADWMSADKPTELSRIKLKNLNSTARPFEQQAFSPPDPTAIWHSLLALKIYIFVVVNFDAQAQASDFRIERKQVVFLCWKQNSNPEGFRHLFASRLNACWQTNWAIEDQA